MRVSAQHKNARISAQKARLVADLIRGKELEQDLNNFQLHDGMKPSMTYDGLTYNFLILFLGSRGGSHL